MLKKVYRHVPGILLRDVQSRQRSDIVSVELEGETDFISELPIVTRVTPEGNRLDITLAPEADPQDLLRSLMDRVRVQAFEVKVPSLHEIFVDLVGKSDAEAA